MLLLTMKDEKKVTVIHELGRGKITYPEAARVLGRSIRTVYRLAARIKAEGVRGVIHRNRGRPSHRKTPEASRRRVIELAQGKYQDVNDTHFMELLEKHEGLRLGRETVRRILREAHMPAKRKRSRPKYRSRRERKEAMGLMLQIDGSPHDWLEGRGPYLTLLGAIDDATGHAWARFKPTETTWGYFELMQNVFDTHGLPLSLYSDRHSIFHVLREPTILEQLKDVAPLTQFGRAMEELGIKLLKAWSPQAKGRIERLWETFQDRLVVELRLAGVSNEAEANKVLETFLPAYIAHFAVPARSATPVFRKTPPHQILDRILCLKETRVVNNDHTVSFEGLALQIPSSKSFHSIAKQRVDVLQLKAGGVEIQYKKKIVATFSPEAVSRMIKKYPQLKSNLKVA